MVVGPSPGSAQGVFVTPNITDAPREEVRYEGVAAQVHGKLRRFGLGDVDPRGLTPGQIGQIVHLTGLDRPHGEIRNRLETVIRGDGLGRRILDRVVR